MHGTTVKSKILLLCWEVPCSKIGHQTWGRGLCKHVRHRGMANVMKTPWCLLITGGVKTKMIMGIDGMTLTGQNRATQRKTCPTATLATKNPTFVVKRLLSYGVPRSYTRQSVLRQVQSPFQIAFATDCDL